MALGVWVPCPCGAQYRAYIPKHQLFTIITGPSIDWSRIDAREEADGAVSEIRAFADRMGQTFLDTRECRECSVCGRPLDVLGDMQEKMLGRRYRVAG